jgi:hypothetical protein
MLKIRIEKPGSLSQSFTAASANGTGPHIRIPLTPTLCMRKAIAKFALAATIIRTVTTLVDPHMSIS